MKINIRSREYEIKKKHIYRAAFCGAVGCAIFYRRRNNQLIELLDDCNKTMAQAKVVVDELTGHCVNSGIATLDKTKSVTQIKFDY
jgi:hypothetical protein